MAEIHQKLMQPINREEWIRKIWGPNQNVESHENLEKITILCKYKPNRKIFGIKTRNCSIAPSRRQNEIDENQFCYFEYIYYSIIRYI